MTIKRFRATVTCDIELFVDTTKFTRKVMNTVNKDDEIHQPLEKCGYDLKKHMARIARLLSYQDHYSLDHNKLEPSDFYGDFHEIGIRVSYVGDPDCDDCEEV